MAGATRITATYLGPLLIGILVLATGSASGETLSGKISAIDRTARTVNVRPFGSKTDRTLHVDKEWRSGSEEWAGLRVGQMIIAGFDGETGALKKVQVVMSPALTGASDPGRESPTTQSPGKPRSNGIAVEPTREVANRRYGLSTETVRSIDAVLTYELMMPGVRAREWVVVAAQAPELPSQMSVRSALDPDGHPTWDLSPGHRRLLVSRIAANAPGNSNRISACAQYQATLQSRHLYRRQAGGDPGSETEAIPLGIEERRRALARGGTYELDAPEFRRWLSTESLSMAPQESEIDYARRVFLALKRSFTYEFREGMDRRLVRVCTTRRSDCGGLSILFAAALRVQEIPARILVGRWAKSAVPGDQLGGSSYYQWHVKAEFYAEGVGWIPADPAAGLVYDNAPDGLRYFGHDEGDFLTLHVDPDLVLDTVHFGAQPTPFLNGGLGVWVVGSGSLVNPRVRQDWQVREVGASSRSSRVAESLKGIPTSR